MVRKVASPEDREQAVRFMRDLYSHQGYSNPEMQLPAGAVSYIFHRAEKIIGVTSILEGKRMLQLDRYFEFDLGAMPPEGISKLDVIEIARTASLGGYGNMNRFFLSLMRVVKEHALAGRTKYWIAAMKTPLISMFQKHGWPMRDVPAKLLNPAPDDPMYSYLNTPPEVRIVISPIAESIELSERWLNKSKNRRNRAQAVST